MSFNTPDLSDENPEARALSPILKNLGGKKVFWGKIETLQCPGIEEFQFFPRKLFCLLSFLE